MSGWSLTMRDQRHVDIWPDTDGIPDLPQVTANENWCFDCGELISVHPGWYPITAYVQMIQHWEQRPHNRLRVDKSAESGLWRVYYGHVLLRTCHSWKHAYAVAFERHPWTKHMRHERKLWS